MALKHISQVIGDPEVFVDHMIKDAMRSPKDNLPQYRNHKQEEYIEQWEKENNRSTGRGGHLKTQANSSDKTSVRCTQSSSKRHKIVSVSDAS